MQVVQRDAFSRQQGPDGCLDGQPERPILHPLTVGHLRGHDGRRIEPFEHGFRQRESRSHTPRLRPDSTETPTMHGVPEESRGHIVSRIVLP